MNAMSKIQGEPQFQHAMEIFDFHMTICDLHQEDNWFWPHAQNSQQILCFENAKEVNFGKI